MVYILVGDKDCSVEQPSTSQRSSCFTGLSEGRHRVAQSGACSTPRQSRSSGSPAASVRFLARQSAEHRQPRACLVVSVFSSEVALSHSALGRKMSSRYHARSPRRRIVTWHDFFAKTGSSPVFLGCFDKVCFSVGSQVSLDILGVEGSDGNSSYVIPICCPGPEAGAATVNPSHADGVARSSVPVSFAFQLQPSTPLDAVSDDTVC